MANTRDFIVFDFETGGANPLTAQPTQIAAIAIHGRKLTLQPGGTFNSEIRPIIDDKGFRNNKEKSNQFSQSTSSKSSVEKIHRICKSI
jgi:DNA polymerase III epsilon subunit-like protein